MEIAESSDGVSRVDAQLILAALRRDFNVSPEFIYNQMSVPVSQRDYSSVGQRPSRAYMLMIGRLGLFLFFSTGAEAAR